ncbi:MAG TPA: efflux RND transporter periplasmic adaptor subunit [Vicinamibacteria bacterium]|nr:efflux RND transporter periplasmic adaptor subunit [Vicinamibacteria bacterium]
MDHNEPTSPAAPVRARALTFAAAVLLAAAAGSACKKGSGPQAFPGMPVEAVTLALRPVERTSEFVGTVKSRRSTDVQPQAEGFITRILVRSGDRVSPGTPLMRIDARAQQAAVAGLESQRAARQADVQYARQQAERMKTLLAAGAASQAEMEQAQTALSTSEAQLRATEALVREQRVGLAYHQVSAPVAGVVGDIPVRVGDSVTRSSVLTTIDQAAGLELYINVPVQEAQSLRVGLPVRLLDERGEVLSSEKLSFVSSAVDPGTQSVLAKAALETAGSYRTEQFVRARVVWTEAPALTVPIVALNRINGQFFAYVAEAGEGGQTVARQRAVDPGPIVGNDYVVRSGLKPGERLIVSGVQKIRDGAPVTVLPPAPAAAAPAVRKGG